MTSATGSWVVLAILVFVALVLLIGVWYYTYIYEYTGQLTGNAILATPTPGFPPPKSGPGSQPIYTGAPPDP